MTTREAIEAIPYYETESAIRKQNRKFSDELLQLLIKHHSDRLPNELRGVE